MNILFGALLLLAVLAVIALDVGRKINLMHLVPLTAILLVLCNLPLLWALLPRWRYLMDLPRPAQYQILVSLTLLLLYLLLRVSVFPMLDGHATGIRLKLMIGGRVLAYRALWMLVVQPVFLLCSYGPLLQRGLSPAVLGANIGTSLLFVLALLLNGVLRLFCTSRRLSILRRLLMLLTMWVPLVNLLVLRHACRLVRDEYDFALYKKDLENTRADFDLCRTKYPLLMVHGVLFRDLKYFNYWGRVPKTLLRYGATIYYGNQEAVGTVANNGRDIHKRILEMLEETGSEKVNIIAHSKGGLDARYAVHQYGLGDKVASLTTISTPHRGCRFVDRLLKLLPDAFVRYLDHVVNRTFRSMGDKNPDFYTAAHQFTTAHSAQFNEQVTDDPMVYYQSYVACMRGALSDSLLTVPYLMIKPLEGENDGLVSVESAKWGNFRGILQSRGRRGVSHGDIIDLKREDYRGFDIVETYVGIVSDLKQMGY